jgi:hypothetical protein
LRNAAVRHRRGAHGLQPDDGVFGRPEFEQFLELEQLLKLQQFLEFE